MSDFDEGSIQFEGEQLERVHEAEAVEWGRIQDVWTQLSPNAQSVCAFIHGKIMRGKFDNPNPHNHITFLNQTRRTWLRQSGVRLEDLDA